MTNSVLGSFLGNMLGNMMMMGMKNQMGWGQQYQGQEREEMGKMEELLKMSMATEMFDVMRAYNEFKVTYIAFELQPDKADKMICAPSEHSDQAGLKVVFAVWSESLLSTWRNLGSLAQRRPSLGARSFCWLCRAAAHFCERTQIES